MAQIIWCTEPKLHLLLIASLVTISPLWALKVLHITFHGGCKNDIEEVGRELNLDVTSWFIEELERKQSKFWEGNYYGNDIYNIGPQRASLLWERHKEFFNSFDLIITSDTAPLSRIFLQNGWKKPLLVWICNRFDYSDGDGGEDHFPDSNYYSLIKKATTMPNVRIISYTPYEHVYARRKGIEFGTHTIKPIGGKTEKIPNFKSSIPTSIDKHTTLFLYPRLSHHQLKFVQTQCSKHGIKTYSGIYNGPQDLEEFRGIIYFPYQWSNLALFEGIQRGIIHFVPSERFVHANKNNPIRYTTLNEFSLCEWYSPENRECIVYFDSWDDLKKKIETTDYAKMKQKISAVGTQHRKTMLARWKKVFTELTEPTA